MRVYGLWYGGSSYAAGTIQDHLEVFTSVRAAGRALLDRYESGGRIHCEATYADGRTESVVYPTVERDGCEMQIFLYDPRGVRDPYPDRLLTLGPRLGIREQRC